MNQLFHSATVRLTTWYVIILASICLMFSVIVYQITMNEVSHRLDSYGLHTQEIKSPSPVKKLFSEIRSRELTATRANLVVILFYVNVIIIVSGGFGAYFLARHTLRPIEEAHDQQSRFVSDASHELRTPLATMTTELEVALRDSTLTKQEMRELLDSNLEEVQRLTTLSNMLLALSTGKTDSLKRTQFDLVAVTNAIIERYPDTSQKIIVKLSRSKINVVAHQSSIEELITILIDNALKYSNENSDIAISIAAKQKVSFQISNTGPGIAEEHLPKIFDRFYRADTSRSGNNGYGLGLALAKQISDIHQADLSVDSTPGKKTTFSFALPLKK